MQHVLVVEDDAGLLNVVSAFLREERFEVDTAATGREALESIERQPPSVVLLDMNLPIMNGWELASELRARHLEVPILVMTAARDARRCATEIGAAGYVAKPVSLPVLLRELDAIAG
jgi:two-component system, chemotaxis family, chemotaxis protein CheY